MLYTYHCWVWLVLLSFSLVYAVSCNGLILLLLSTIHKSVSYHFSDAMVYAAWSLNEDIFFFYSAKTQPASSTSSVCFSPIGRKTKK